MWMEEKLGTRINTNRTAEALATGADRIAVGCPFCKVMLTDGVNAAVQDGTKAEGEGEVVDVAQMLLAAVRRGNEGGEHIEINAEGPGSGAEKSRPQGTPRESVLGPAADGPRLRFGGRRRICRQGGGDRRRRLISLDPAVGSGDAGQGLSPVRGSGMCRRHR
jgi:hypothetical protein